MSSDNFKKTFKHMVYVKTIKGRIVHVADIYHMRVCYIFPLKALLEATFKLKFYFKYTEIE